MDNQSLSHSRYSCAYHIVFIPKYRRKVMFGDLRKEVGEAISKVCRMEEVTIIKAAMLPDHVHMYVSIPPKESVAKLVGRIEGKSSLLLFDRHPEYRVNIQKCSIVIPIICKIVWLELGIERYSGGIC